ncbi:MAG: calcium-binding protein, partial [Betaproteobacteria bacterium]
PDFIYGDDDGNTLSGGGNNDFLFGANGNDTLYGDSGADLLVDVKGADALYGGSGDDVLIADASVLQGFGSLTPTEVDSHTDVNSPLGDLLDGGAGNDVLFVGGGSDTIRYASLSDGTDTVAGFDTAAAASGGDVIDISAVLDLPGNTWADGGSFSDATAGAYLTFANDGHGNTVVAVDIDGVGAGTPVTLAILQGVDPTDALSLLDDNFTLG